MQNAKIFLKVREGKRLEMLPICPTFDASTCAGVQAFCCSGPAKRLALVLWSCVPSFRLLYCFAFGALSLNMVLFRVLRASLARFGVVVWVYVVLVRCVACVTLYA